MQSDNTHTEDTIRREITERGRALFGEDWIASHEQEIDSLTQAVARVEAFPLDAFAMLDPEAGSDDEAG